MVLAEGVAKSFGSVPVLKGVNLEVAKGEVVCMLGPSGSGKSTFLRCINHLETIDAGWLAVDGELVGYRRDGERLIEEGGRETASRRARIGMVFQHFNLFAHMTALRNVMEGPVAVRGMDKASAKTLAMDLLASVGLAEKADAYPSQLSGGQQQRVAIARAMAMEPKLLLFDEPTSALDPELVSEVLDVMRGLARQGMTMMVVTHEISFARDVADRIVFLDKGLVIETGTPAQVLGAPSHPRTREFLASVG
jgi:polar amino acid transport system ATP-binding protein